jgi:hypothetical protein
MLLSHDNWEELEGELKAFELLTQARELILTSNAIVARSIDHALARLHPAVRDPLAREEFDARKRGEDLRVRTAPVLRGFSQEELDAAVKRALEARSAEPVRAPDGQR